LKSQEIILKGQDQIDKAQDNEKLILAELGKAQDNGRALVTELGKAREDNKDIANVFTKAIVSIVGGASKDEDKSDSAKDGGGGEKKPAAKDDTLGEEEKEEGSVQESGAKANEVYGDHYQFGMPASSTNSGIIAGDFSFGVPTQNSGFSFGGTAAAAAAGTSSSSSSGFSFGGGANDGQESAGGQASSGMPFQEDSKKMPSVSTPETTVVGTPQRDTLAQEQSPSDENQGSALRALTCDDLELIDIGSEFINDKLEFMLHPLRKFQFSSRKGRLALEAALEGDYSPYQGKQLAEILREERKMENPEFVKRTIANTKFYRMEDPMTFSKFSFKDIAKFLGSNIVLVSGNSGTDSPAAIVFNTACLIEDNLDLSELIIPAAFGFTSEITLDNMENDAIFVLSASLEVGFPTVHALLLTSSSSLSVRPSRSAIL
jgi:hypothetical protein